MLFCIYLYDLSAWCGCWFVVYIRRFIYIFLNVYMCPFDYTAVAGMGRWVRKPVNHTSLVVVVTLADRPKLLRNRCVIGTFLWRCLCCHFALSTFPFV